MLGLRFPALFTGSVAFLASAALSAAAEPSVSILKIPDVPCTGSWTGPSADNSFDCGGGQITDFVKDPSVWSIAVPFALGFLCLVPISCIILCGRYCCNCCGSAKVRPNSFCGGKCCGEDPDDTLTEAERVAAYSQASINFVNILCLFTFGLGVAGIVLSYFGCATLASAVLDITPTVFNVADWALDLVTQIKAAVADPNDPNSYPDGFDMSMFDDVAKTLTDVRGDLEDGVKPFAPAVALGVRIFGFVSIVPGLVLFTPAVCAFFKVRQILPLILIVVSFALQFLYYFFSTFCLLMVILFGMLHKEMNAANEPQPEQHKSVMQWYLIPMCDKEAPFESALDNLNEMEYDASVSACNKLLDFCTPSNAPWNPFGPNPEKVFYCNINDANTDCANVSLLSDVIGGMYVLDGVPPSEACGTAVDNNTMCTFEECASSCVNSDTRSSADEAMTNLRTAERIVNALDDILKPWLSCSALIKKVLSLGFTKTMKTVEKGSSTLAAGSLCIGSGLLLAIITAFLGQKRFIDRSWAVKELEGYDARENGDEMRSTKPMYDSGFNQQQLQQSQKQEQEGIPMAVFAAPTQVSPKASPLYVPDGGHPQQFEDQHFTAPLENPSADAAGHPNAI